jgi:hypothetical protein
MVIGYQLFGKLFCWKYNKILSASLHISDEKHPVKDPKPGQTNILVMGIDRSFHAEFFGNVTTTPDPLGKIRERKRHIFRNPSLKTLLGG